MNDWIIACKSRFTCKNISLLETAHAGRGLFTTADLTTSEPLVVIPRHGNLITRSFVRSLSIDPKHGTLNLLINAIASACEMQEQDYLRLFILYLKSRIVEDPFWNMFLSLLPTSFETPLYFHDQMLDLLQGTALEYGVKSKRSFLQNRFASFQNALSIFREHTHWFDITFDDFLWAESIVKSRMISISNEKGNVENHDSIALIPFLDFCNHSFQPNAEVRFTKEAVYMYPNSSISLPIQSGTEITLCYGNEPNGTLLFNHGFIDPQNPNPSPIVVSPPPLIEYSINLPAEDPNWELIQHVINCKMVLFRKLNLASVIKILPLEDDVPHLLDNETFLALLLCVINMDDRFHCEIHSAHSQDGHDHASHSCAPNISVTIGEITLASDHDRGLEQEALLSAFKSHPLYEVLKLRVWHVLEDLLSSQGQTIQQNLDKISSQETEHLASTKNAFITSSIQFYLEETLEGIERICVRLSQLKEKSMMDPIVLDYLSSAS